MPNKNSVLKTVLSLVLVVSMLVTVAACSKSDALKEIVAEGYIEDFFVGDEFTAGEAFTVRAIYSDGRTEDVTAKVTVEPGKGYDMSKAGNFDVTVSFENKKFVYTVYVSDYDAVLCKLEVEDPSVFSASLGDGFDFSALKLIGTYENAQKRMIRHTFDSLKDVEITVIGPSGAVQKDHFSEMGTHTVKLTVDRISTSFTVEIGNVDLTSVKSALIVATYGSRFVSSGKADLKEEMYEAGNTTYYNYAFGDGYTFVEEQLKNAGSFDYLKEYHYSLDTESGEIGIITLENGEKISNDPVEKTAMNGPKLIIWYAEYEFGIEATLNNLYGFASVASDLKETADASTKTYTFSFGRVQDRLEEVPYYYLTDVKFTLDDSYAIKKATVKQSLYVDAVTTDKDGNVTIASSLGKANKYTEITVTQEIGERTATNPYAEESAVIKNFELEYNGSVMSENEVINGTIGDTIQLKITSVAPSGASLSNTLMYLGDGVNREEVSHTIFYGTGFAAYRNDPASETIYVRFLQGGEYDLIVRTALVKKTVKVNVTGVPPTVLSSQTFNPAIGGFSKNPATTVVAGQTMYFRSIPNANADKDFTVVLTSGDADNSFMQPTTVLDQFDCWSFMATQPGVYVITMTSTIAPQVTCTLTITVIEAPNYASLLNGNYSATDTEGNVYDLKFVYGSYTDGVTKGTLSTTKTLPSGTKNTQNFNYSVADSELNITLQATSGDALGIALRVDDQGRLVLEDRYGEKYVLNS